MFSSLEAGHDDQPITFIRPTVAAWGFLTNWTSVGARVSAATFRLADTASRSMATYALTFSQTFRGGAVTVDGDAGATQESWSGAIDGIGSVRLLAKPASWSSISVRAERLAYTATEASLSTRVMHSRYTGELNVERRGWTGQAGAQWSAFPGFSIFPSPPVANHVTSLYGWFLAPVTPARQSALQIGYGVAAQDSPLLLYRLANPIQTVPPSSPRFDLSGAYWPYYTPRNVRVHSLLAAATAASGRVTVHANGSYGFSASEDAPHIVSMVTTPRGPSPVIQEIPRSFHPWNARASLEARVSPNATLVAAAEALRSAFYHAQTITLSLDYTVGAPSRSSLLAPRSSRK